MKLELDAGVNGFYVNGATGEGLFLSEGTRREMIETAVAVTGGRAKIINHVGAVDTQQALRLAKHSAEVGCDAISSLVPNYVTSYTTDQILDYYKRLHGESGLPVLVYCTSLVGSAPFEFMKRAIEVEGLIGCKFTLSDYYSMHRITELNGGDINVINGPDEMLICGLTMGADGGIGGTYNVMPKVFRAIYDNFRAGDIAAAQQWQYKANRLIDVILRFGVQPSLKEILGRLGFDCGHCVYPQKQLTEEERAGLFASLDALDYEREYL
jgi:Dihydrodipicolinate synthase/N-acetylneuraminate lyase